MADSGRRSAIIGCAGVLCLAIYWAAIFFPQIAERYLLTRGTDGERLIFLLPHSFSLTSPGLQVYKPLVIAQPSH